MVAAAVAAVVVAPQARHRPGLIVRAKAPKSSAVADALVAVVVVVAALAPPIHSPNSLVEPKRSPFFCARAALHLSRDVAVVPVRSASGYRR